MLCFSCSSSSSICRSYVRSFVRSFTLICFTNDYTTFGDRMIVCFCLLKIMKMVLNKRHFLSSEKLMRIFTAASCAHRSSRRFLVDDWPGLIISQSRGTFQDTS